jgi:hypothetical protein
MNVSRVLIVKLIIIAIATLLILTIVVIAMNKLDFCWMGSYQPFVGCSICWTGRR